jgi:hypothetical protein
MSIELELCCGPWSPFQQSQREEQRLKSLAQWVRRWGHGLNKISLPVQVSQIRCGFVTCELEAAPAIPRVMEALAAAGQEPGGLQLHQLRVPALGGTPIPAICRTLSVCPQLRELHLDNSFSSRYITSSWPSDMELPATLQQLTQLTCLRLAGSLFKYNSQYFGSHGPDDLFRSLPSSLVVLEVDSYTPRGTVRHMDMSSSSLQHLVSLKQLALPEHISRFDRDAVGDGPGGGPNHLTVLTALTHLVFEDAVSCAGRSLLAAPNLVKVEAEEADAEYLHVLAAKPALRSLHVRLDIHSSLDTAPALQQLTQLTGLGLVTGKEPIWDFEEPFEDIDEEVALREWGGALSSLTGLRWLGVQHELLEQVDLTALTALTSLRVTCDTPSTCGSGVLSVLRGLSPAHGQLLEVELAGVFVSHQEEYRAAVAAALGDVVVSWSYDPRAWSYHP